MRYKLATKSLYLKMPLDNKKEFYLEKRSWPEGQSLWLDEDGKVIGGNDFREKELILVFFLSFSTKIVLRANFATEMRKSNCKVQTQPPAF